MKKSILMLMLMVIGTSSSYADPEWDDYYSKTGPCSYRINDGGAGVFLEIYLGEKAIAEVDLKRDEEPEDVFREFVKESDTCTID